MSWQPRTRIQSQHLHSSHIPQSLQLQGSDALF
ncbi:hypothetical protein LEMLEM_LOCUS25014 [Lemmus lemmus]